MKHSIPARLHTLLLGLALLVSAPLTFGHGDEEHGSHDASYGGLVMMYIDLHFEVVLPEEGGVRLYFSDATRAELPAAVVSNLEVELLREDAAPEFVAMTASPAGDYWLGDSTPVTNEETIIRVAFLFQNEPVVFELPARLFPSFMQKQMDAMPAHQA